MTNKIEEKTTIKISKETKKRLDNLKEFDMETYEEIIKKLLHILNLLRKDPADSSKVLDRITENIKRRLSETEEKRTDKK